MDSDSGSGYDYDDSMSAGSTAEPDEDWADDEDMGSVPQRRVRTPACVVLSRSRCLGPLWDLGPTRCPAHRGAALRALLLATEWLAL
jgi:hypothetical protein